MSVVWLGEDLRTDTENTYAQKRLDCVFQKSLTILDSIITNILGGGS